MQQFSKKQTTMINLRFFFTIPLRNLGMYLFDWKFSTVPLSTHKTYKKLTKHCLKIIHQPLDLHHY